MPSRLDAPAFRVAVGIVAQEVSSPGELPVLGPDLTARIYPGKTG